MPTGRDRVTVPNFYKWIVIFLMLTCAFCVASSFGMSWRFAVLSDDQKAWISQSNDIMKITLSLLAGMVGGKAL